MTLRRYIVLIICLLILSSAGAQTVGKPMLSLVDEGDSLFHLRFETQDCQPQVDTHSVQGYSRLEWTGMTFGTGRVGCPDMPSLHALVRLPKGSTLEVKDVDAVSTVWMRAVPNGKPLVPVTEGWVKDGPRPEYQRDEKVYGSMAPYRGGERVEVENLGAMGSEQLFRVTVRPVYYQPVGGNLVYDGRIDATLQIGETAPQESANVYLIVSRPQFREGLQPFVRWKRQMGYEVVERYADTPQRDSVKALIGNQCPRYILLVGDVEQLQAYPGTTHPEGLGAHVTDLYYAEYTGDYLPDALLGRWPVSDTAELGAVVRKTLRYEQGVGLDTARLKRLLLVAGAESQVPAPITSNGHVNYVGREAKLARPLLDTLCYRNPASADQRGAILGDLRQGAAVLSYTAHCTAAGWTSPAVSFSSIDTLDNPQPLLYVNNCCLSNAFNGTCFGEQLLRKADGGAVGVIGATNSTLWNEDYYWAVGPKYPFSLTPVFDDTRPGAFDRWLGQVGDVQSQGELLAAGNLAVTAFGSPYAKFYWETYCLLGDPSLRPWVGVPQTLTLDTINGVYNGAGRLYFGGTPGVTVTAMQQDTLLGVGTIGEDGLLVLDLNSTLDTTPLVVTATGAGYWPRIDTLAVQPVDGMGVALREVVVGDSVVRCRVENVGTVPLYGLRVVLSQLDADSTFDALVAEQQTVVDTLMPGLSRQVSLPVQVTVIGMLRQWRTQLFAWDSTEGMLCCLTVQGSISVDYPSATFRLMETDGSVARRLLPSHPYNLQAIVSGAPADEMMLTLVAMPTGDTLLMNDSLFVTPDTLTHLHLEASLSLGNHQTSYDYYMAGSQMDGFEDGFDSYPWQQSGTRPWMVDSSLFHSGQRSVRSGVIDYRQTSDLQLEVVLPQRDTLSYWARTSSEVGYDKLLFMVDGVQRGNALWGESNWRHYSVVIDAGRHTLQWHYVKDESGSAGNDCAWIDDVRLPLAWWNAAYGWFGDISTEGMDQPAMPLLRIYPNPCHGMVTVESDKPVELRVLNLYGREVCVSRHSEGVTTLGLTNLPDGIYLLQATTVAGCTYHKLVICQ